MSFKIGDKIRRKEDERSGWWCDLCDRYSVKPDATLTVVKVNDYNEVFVKELRPHFGYQLDRFELVEALVDDQIKEAYDLAQSLVGKTVKLSSDKTNYTVKHVLLRRKGDTYGLGHSSNKHLDEHGWLVAVAIGSMNVPVGMVEEVPTEVTVKLNDSYSAVVSKDTVKVGCQTFPIDILKKLQTAADSLK